MQNAFCPTNWEPVESPAGISSLFLSLSAIYRPQCELLQIYLRLYPWGWKDSCTFSIWNIIFQRGGAIIHQDPKFTSLKITVLRGLNCLRDHYSILVPLSEQGFECWLSEFKSWLYDCLCYSGQETQLIGVSVSSLVTGIVLDRAS